MHITKLQKKKKCSHKGKKKKMIQHKNYNSTKRILKWQCIQPVTMKDERENELFVYCCSYWPAHWAIEQCKYILRATAKSTHFTTAKYISSYCQTLVCCNWFLHFLWRNHACNSLLSPVTITTKYSGFRCTRDADFLTHCHWATEITLILLQCWPLESSEFVIACIMSIFKQVEILWMSHACWCTSMWGSGEILGFFGIWGHRLIKDQFGNWL